MPAHVPAECPVALEPAPGRTFSLGNQTAQGLPLEPGFGVVRVHLGYSVTVSCRCFFELQKLLVCTKIKTDIGSPRSLADWKGRGTVSSPLQRWCRILVGKALPCVTQSPPWGHASRQDSPGGSTSSPEGRNSFLMWGLICLFRHKSCCHRLPCQPQWCGRHLTPSCLQAAALFPVC